MKQNTIQKIVLSGLLAAVVSTATLIALPLPTGGFANLGDCFVIISGIVLGPVYGFLSAGIGSALSDVFLGWASYAPATFVIKGVMALVVALIAGRKPLKLSFVRLALSSVLSEIIMVSGYFLFEIPLYGLAGALADIAGNSVQGVVGAASALVLTTVLFKTKIIDRISK